MVNSSQRSGLILLVLTLAAFMASLDVFIVNVAFDAIGADFPGTGLTDLSWVLNAYAILFAALLVPAGRLADRYGRKRGFLLGLVLFTGASAAGAAAGSIWAAVGALAAALGPAVGGMLVEASWQWVFLVNIPIGVAAVVAAILWVPDSRDTSVTRNPDLVGATLLASSVGALSLAIVEGPSWGWTSGRTNAAWTVTVIAQIGFVLSSRRHPAPVVSPTLMRVKAFAWSNVTALLFSVPFAAALLTNILWMQKVWHYSAIKTGFAVAPGPQMVPLVALVSARLSRRLPVGVIVSVGCVLFGLGSVVVAPQAGATPDYVGDLLPGWLIGGAGVGLALPNILSAATADLPPSQAATGSAVVNMSRQIGTALGVSLVVAVLGTPTTYDAAHTAFQHAWWLLAAVAAAGALSAPLMTSVPASAPAPTPAGAAS
jgi:MFS family permease